MIKIIPIIIDSIFCCCPFALRRPRLRVSIPAPCCRRPPPPTPGSPAHRPCVAGTPTAPVSDGTPRTKAAPHARATEPRFRLDPSSSETCICDELCKHLLTVIRIIVPWIVDRIVVGEVPCHVELDIPCWAQRV